MSDTLHALLVEYRCPVVDRLELIYEHEGESDRDRFIAVTVPDHPHGYVQCIFFDGKTKMLCEGSSGFYFDPVGSPRTFHLAPEAIAALGRLGFSTDDSDGNFQQQFDVGAPPDFNGIADLILRALHDGYGARADSNLKFNAPLADADSSTCIPLS